MTKFVTLDNAVARNKEFPDTFEIPSDSEIAKVKVGDYVKLIFQSDEGTERMWVKVAVRNGTNFGGRLANDPVLISIIVITDYVEFDSEHIVDISPQ